MGCSTCGSVTTTAPSPHISRVFNSTPVDDPNCPYNMTMLLLWADKLSCIKDKLFYPSLGIAPSALNMALGTVLSALNYPSYPCHFKNKLDEIQNMIIIIQNSGKC